MLNIYIHLITTKHGQQFKVKVTYYTQNRKDDKIKFMFFTSCEH